MSKAKNILAEKIKIEQKVMHIVMAQFDLTDSVKLSLESHIVNDLGADSLDQVELIMTAEEYFEVEVSDEEAEQIQTIGDAVRYFSKPLNV